ncbi:MAG: BACON domain-containing protein [Bacteroidales bacterium]|nr:BACON domain-containing protein [Bacteroidales bacterium]
MEYRIHIAFLSLVLASVIGACQREGVILEPDTLNLSVNGLITFDSESQTEDIEVTTNQNSWTFVKSAEWMTVAQTKTGLTITVDANPSVETRSAELLVISGEAREKIRIEQLGLNVIISTDKNEIQTNQWGGKFTLDINSNDANWVVESDEEWIHVLPVYAMSELRITVDETTAREDRVGKIYVKSQDGRGLHEISVNQKGSMYFLLPFDEFLSTAEDLRSFELDRKSEILQVPDGYFNLYNWGFKTKSPAFNQITYLVYNNRYKTAKVYCANAAFFQDKLNLEAQKTFLLRNGYEQRDDLVFYNADKGILAEIVKEASIPYVYFTYRPQQPAPQPSMDRFPYRYLDFSKGAFELISAWETENGGNFNAERSDKGSPYANRDILWFDETQDPLFATVYRVSRATSNHTIDGVFIILNDSSKVYYFANGAPLLTDEFIALMKKEGFTMVGDIGSGYRFFHLDKMYDVLVSYVKYEGVDEPKVQLHVTPLL